MLIGFVISMDLCLSKYNGIKIQAETWAKGLAQQGHEVVLVSPWDKYDRFFDVIHIIGVDKTIEELVKKLKKFAEKIVCSPIIDTIQPLQLYRLSTFWGCKKFRLYSINYSIRQASKNIYKWVVRSEFEKKYVNKAYDIPVDQIIVIPLSYRTPEISYYPEKENFCLHVSVLSDERKNVLRLILAAKKYKFNLVLAGTIKEGLYSKKIRDLIQMCPNITYLGRVSDEKLVSLYKTAKVFALPSINEGVGLVALEAASYGCDIVITEKGGPKEYYKNLAFIVNPYKVETIGQAVTKALECKEKQPKLQKYILENYNLPRCMEKLILAYT